jgi:hypothetical protein
MKSIELNALQTISVTGVIVCLLAQIGLYLIGKTVDTFWAVYPTWVVVFLLGTLLRFFAGPDDHHHHHHHDHDHHH